MLKNDRAKRVRIHRRLRTLARLILGACILLSPVWMYFLFLTSPEDIPYGSSLAMVPVLMLACGLLLALAWKNSLDLKLLFGSAMLARCLFSGLFLWMSFTIYESNADAFHYWDRGLYIANDFSVVGWAAFKPPFWSTNFIANLMGFLTLGTGNALPTLFILFALLGLWGGYFFFRAFSIAFPSADALSYGYFPLLLPSIMFWSCSIGKDALAQFFVGMAVLGFAKITRKLSPAAVLTFVAGVAGMLAIRPHVAAMLALAAVFPYALSKTRGGPLSIAAKILIVPLLLLGTLYIAREAASFLGVDKGSSQQTVDTVNGISKSSDYGGSAYGGGSLSLRIAEAPFLVFRPFPFEAHNATSAVSALEGVGLMLFAWKRRRKVWRGLVQHWRHPFVAFLLCYVTVFSIAFAAATSNFGILVRERIMMVPMFLMLFSMEFRTGVPDSVPAATRRRPLRPFPNSVRMPSTTGLGAD